MLSKRLFAMLLSAVLLLTLLTACKGDSKENSSADSSEYSSSELSSAEVGSADITSAENSTQSKEQSIGGESSVNADSTSNDSTSVSESSAVKDDSKPHSSVADSSAPNSSVADSSAPNSSVADSSAPNSSVADSSAPNSSVADSSAPNSSVADSSAPNSSVADSSAPNSSVADSSAPNSSVADSSAPNSSVADSSVPNSSVADSSIADSSIADSSEEISVDPLTPLNPLPEQLYADSVDSFFNDSLFIGYSIMMHFGRYVGQWRTEVDPSVLGNAIFCAAPGVSFNADKNQTPSTPDNSLPIFRGQAYNFADLPAATGCKTLYIGLTVYSELSYSAGNVNGAYNAVVAGIERIRAKNPNLNIVLLAGTYNSGIFQGLKERNHSNDKVLAYNNKVLDYCNSHGIDFVDVATPLVDHRGYFVADYATDGEYHIQKQAYCLWVRQLRDYARRKQNGTWQNITEMPNYLD